MTLTKYDEYGEIIWEKGYGENINNGSKSEDGYWVVETNDNGFILVGTTWFLKDIYQFYRVVLLDSPY